MIIDALLVLGLAAAALGVSLVRPTLLVVLAVPATFLVMRLGSGGPGSNVSFSDALLFVGALAGLPLVRWSQSPRLKQILMLGLVYEASTAFSIVAHPNRYDIVEWFHQLVMVVGASLVGYVVVERTRAKAALGAFLAAAGGVAVWVMVAFAVNGFHNIDSLPDGFQKNTLGALFVMAVLIAQFAPPWANLTGRWVRVVKYACVLGILAVDSRQAMVALIVSAGVIFLRDRHLGERPKLLLAALVAVGVVCYVTVTNELASHNQTDSFNTRTQWYRQTLHIWSQYPLFGVGERFWYTGQYGLHIQPPNAEISMLATGGLLGTLGFLVLTVGSLRMLWKLPAAAGAMAFGLLLAHFVEGQFDIYWVTSSGSMPWIAAGMALAAADRLDRERDEASGLLRSRAQRFRRRAGDHRARFLPDASIGPRR